MSESDSDENPLWMFWWSQVELLLATMFFEYDASKFQIGNLRSTIRETNKTNGTQIMAFFSKMFDKN